MGVGSTPSMKKRKITKQCMGCTQPHWSPRRASGRNEWMKTRQRARCTLPHRQKKKKMRWHVGSTPPCLCRRRGKPQGGETNENRAVCTLLSQLGCCCQFGIEVHAQGSCYWSRPVIWVVSKMWKFHQPVQSQGHIHQQNSIWMACLVPDMPDVTRLPYLV